MIHQYNYSSNINQTFKENLNYCIEQLESLDKFKNIIGVIIFIDTISDSDYFEKKKQIVEIFEQRNWKIPLNIQAQSFNSIVSIEIWIDEAAESIVYIDYEDISYTRINISSGKAICGFGITSKKESIQLQNQIEYSFETIIGILEKEGMNLSDIVRQWNYVPGITDINNKTGRSLQHYQVFNEIRQNYYSGFSFNDGYPAATGIGTRNGNFDLDFFAVQKNINIVKVGMSNPKQDDAYEYNQKHLLGDTISGTLKKAPLFERAKMLKTNEGIVLFISGTASIIGQETVGIGDIKKQTEITINNMNALVSAMNDYLKSKNNNQFTHLRAYIKNEMDISIVKSVCDSYFPEVSISYLQADVCRDELLVELEGEVKLV